MRKDSLTLTNRDKVWDLMAQVGRIQSVLELLEQDPSIPRAVRQDMGLTEVYCRSLKYQLLGLSRRVE